MLENYYFEDMKLSNFKEINLNNQPIPNIAQKSPYLVQLEAKKQYSWCACGLSKNQPFCDGSHSNSGMKSLKFIVEETKQYNLCGCKHSNNKPFCDGSHSKI